MMIALALSQEQRLADEDLIRIVHTSVQEAGATVGIDGVIVFFAGYKEQDQVLRAAA